MDPIRRERPVVVATLLYPPVLLAWLTVWVFTLVLSGLGVVVMTAVGGPLWLPCVVLVGYAVWWTVGMVRRQVARDAARGLRRI